MTRDKEYKTKIGDLLQYKSGNMYLVYKEDEYFFKAFVVLIKQESSIRNGGFVNVSKTYTKLGEQFVVIK